MIIKIGDTHVEGTTNQIIMHLEQLMLKKHKGLPLAMAVRQYNQSMRFSRTLELAIICGIKVKVIQ
jgi:hypothetical protein